MKEPPFPIALPRRHPSNHIRILALRILEIVLRLRNAPQGIVRRRNQARRARLVRAAVPKHAAAQAFALDVRDFRRRDRGIVVADELLGRGVVAPRRHHARRVRGLSRARLGQRLVVPHAVLPAAGADAGKRLAHARGGFEAAAVERLAHDDLAGRDAGGDVVLDRSVGRVWRAAGVVGAGVEVGVVAGDGVPRAGVVVGHQVEEVEVGVHVGEVEHLVVGRAGGHGGREERGGDAGRGGVCVQCAANGLQEQDEVARFRVVGGVFPVNVDAVEAEVFDKGDGRVGERLATSGGGSPCICKVGAIGPAAN